jgi:hypothetical protein
VGEPFIPRFAVRFSGPGIGNVRGKADDVLEAAPQAFQRSLHVFVRVVELLGYRGTANRLRLGIFTIFAGEKYESVANRSF